MVLCFYLSESLESRDISLNSDIGIQNGRNLPDSSLFVPLCSILDITLTELFSGERIEKEHIIEKTDKVLINVIEDNKMYKILEIKSFFDGMGNC